MTLLDQNNSQVSRVVHVKGELTIRGGSQPPSEPIDARVAVVEYHSISIMLNPTTEWVLSLDSTAAAFIAGGLAWGAGVR